MAGYTIKFGAIASHDNALVASTVDTVTFSESVDMIAVLSDGTAAVYFTTDGTTPAVSGDHCHKLPLSTVPQSATVNVPSTVTTVVQLISTGTPTYSVIRADGS